ncbi:GMP synthase [Terribacillus saccharophilus]|uniref:type 1 glutamine amidotransferase n=1 Tax=Terribacillus saccharophilus TaxID=361277 RepID=UPI000BA4F3EB|nr:type 1 glutamine amidotransferase [Terribacillus saccharophilus]PAF17108.1 GMP synthase [Terribacillus saccharophilus]PAF39712.1 GMP synthase [Terribacillus saccharophilus]
MIIDVLQHVPFEDLAAIKDWGEDRGHSFRVHHLYDKAVLPDAQDITLLIILGGPMSANDADYWIEEERKLIRQLIDLQKPLFGICLGAQQIAKALGATVFQGEQKEVGWHPIQTVTTHFPFIPDKMTVFHWHGEQFSLPHGAIRLFGNEVCENQGFIYRDNVIGLQFHFETTRESMEKLIVHDKDYVDDGMFVQSEEVMKTSELPAENVDVLYKLLDHLVQSARGAV